VSIPGHTNNPNGRPKGSVNRKTQELFDKCEELDVDPFHVLLLFTKGDWHTLGYKGEYTFKTYGENTVEELTISPELRAKCAEKACEYLYAKKKSVAVDMDENGPKKLTIIIDGDDAKL
jgi:hypothetical protein